MKHCCPCCTNTLLRHINQERLYWFCPHCQQAMPTIEKHSRTIKQQIFPRI